jgi:bifunctional DNA-binding transcriptional regulator/antitoxin component of YhaV-PrlF toxin-antitoxin module
VKDEQLNCYTKKHGHRNQYQIVIPRRVREEIGVDVGDLLEARAEKGRLIFEPKSLVDRGIARSIAEFKAGRSHGPFNTHERFLNALHKEAKKAGRTSKKRPAR